jgi:hypothetical protein
MQSQQPQGQLQTQHSVRVDKSNYIMDNHNIKSNYMQALQKKAH